MAKLELDTVYTFNVSPSDSYQYTRAPTKSAGDTDRLKTFNKYFVRFFQQFTLQEIEFYLQTELSEPVTDKHTVQVSRLHFHGYIRFPTVNSLKWFLLYGTSLLEKVCRYEIDTIADPDKWNDYVHKQSFLGLPKITQFEGLRAFYEPTRAKSVAETVRSETTKTRKVVKSSKKR